MIKTARRETRMIFRKTGSDRKDDRNELLRSSYEKKDSAIKEISLDVVCLAASNAILFLLPSKTDFFFYLLFGISAFLFCIGFFRMGFVIKLPTGPKGTFLTGMAFAVSGTVVNIIGLYVIYKDNGSGRSITIAVLLIIEALVFFSVAGSRAENPGTQWKISMVFRIIAALMVISGAAFVIKDHFSMASVTLGTMLVIEAVCMWAMGCGNNPFNTLTSEIRTVPGMKTSIDELYRDFAGVKTQLGYPWIGKISTIKENCIIYGPAEDGFYIYGSYQYGRFCLTGSENLLFPDPEDAQVHVVTESPDQSGTLLSRDLLPEAYARMFSGYMKDGSTHWSTKW